MGCCCRCFWIASAVLVVIIAVLFGIDSQKEKFYVFDQDVLQEIAIDAINNTSSTQEMFSKIANELARRYPGHVETDQECKFIHFQDFTFHF